MVISKFMGLFYLFDGGGEPSGEFGGDKLVAFAVGVVGLGHEVGEFAAVVEVLFEELEAVDKADVILGGEVADLVGLLIEGVVGVIKGGFDVGGGGEKDDFDAGGEGGLDHGGPGLAGGGESEVAIIEAIIDGDDIGVVAEDIASEAGGTGLGRFAADAGDDDIGDGVGKAGAELFMEQHGIGIEGADDGGVGVAGGDAVAVADDVDGAIGRPFLLKEVDDVVQIDAAIRDGGLGGGRGGVEREG